MSYDDRGQQTAHAAQIAGMSARERFLILAVIVLVGGLIVALAGPLRGDPLAAVADPSGAVAPTGSAAPSAPGVVVAPEASPTSPLAIALPSPTPPPPTSPPSTALPTPIGSSLPPPSEQECGPPPDATSDPWAPGLACEHRGANGEWFEYACPANGTLGPIWGTAVYTDDSSVCTAAVHLAFITREAGGTVRIVMSPGLAAYTASSLNGVTSETWGQWGGSFQFMGLAEPRDPFAPPFAPPGQDLWAAAASGHRGAIGETFEYECPADGWLGPVWGTDIYSDDSSVCTAAVHGGVITLEKGGTVRIVIRPGRSSYVGSSRSDVATAARARWDGSFEIVRP